jgi:diguanylate cyclase (GGDEF)-like protein
MTDGRTSTAQSLFIFEPHAALMKRCTTIAVGAGYRVLAAATPEEATAALEECTPSALLIGHSQAGVELSHYVREFTTCRAPLLVMLERAEDRHEALAKMNADGFVLRPFSSSTLQAVLSVAERLRPTAQRVADLERELAEAAPQLRHLASAINSRTGFYQFEAIKDLLVVEVRRAKRYGYPLAILLVGLDPIADRPEMNDSTLQREITGGLAVAIAKATRDIDIPIHYADDRILVFLPHTDLGGAEEVGRRIKRRIKRITYRGEGITAQLTASVGVAGISSGENLTFSRLIKDATVALRAAQLKGGDRVMKRVTAKSAPEL